MTNGGKILTGFQAARRAHYLQKIMGPFPFRHSADWKKVRPVVFESDDWGFCGEAKNRGSIERLCSLGYDLDNPKLRASSYNTLENSSDLNELFNILRSHRDGLGRPPVFTANFVVTNPDFRRIKGTNFSEYHALPISSAFPATWHSGDSLRDAWLLGINNRVWMPEFHGYSHFNFRNWLSGLRNGDERLIDFFEEEMIASSREYPTTSEYLIDPSVDLFADFAEQLSVIRTGCDIFRSTFGYSPTSTIPPHDIWDVGTQRAFLQANLRFIQSERTRISSALGFSLKSVRSAIHGVESSILLFGPLAKLYRNVRLELNDEESSAAATTEYVLAMGSPVVVGTHRVNYVSGVSSSTALSGRRKLDNYLKSITTSIRGGQQLVFMTTPELFQIYLRGYSAMNYGEETIVRNYTPSRVRVVKAGPKRHIAFDLTHDHEIDSSRDSPGSGYLSSPPGTTISFRAESPR